MTRIAAYVAVAALLAAQAVPLAVAQTQVPQLNPNPQTQGGITYVSGGIADDWQQAMESQRGQYNLHLLFAQLGTGAYFANVPVEITDSSGRTVLSAVSQGPFFYARLQPGSYRVTATHAGQAITKKAFVGSGSGGPDLDYRWAGDGSLGNY
jgi:opacity protein-like surface antigen